MSLFSRRHFFFGSLLAGAVPAAGYGSVPSLRALGYKPFYNKLNVAAIGCGGQGATDLNAAARTENIVALCDVDLDRSSATVKRFAKAPIYRDFRVMLDKEGKNIDACTIAIPDFMHAYCSAGVHAARQPCLCREAADANTLGSALAASGGAEV